MQVECYLGCGATFKSVSLLLTTCRCLVREPQMQRRPAIGNADLFGRVSIGICCTSPGCQHCSTYVQFCSCQKRTVSPLPSFRCATFQPSSEIGIEGS